jgi:hypothetical protein
MNPDIVQDDAIKMVFGREAMNAVTEIAHLYGCSEDEAVSRALGMELYLLQQATAGATLILRYKDGREGKIDLFG